MEQCNNLITTDLIRRISKYEARFDEVLTKKYNVKRLVYYEAHNIIYSIIICEKGMTE
jgi:predicted GIY-YIG superfamily endonuclease